MSDYIAKTTASITAQNTGSDGCTLRGDFNISLSGTWSATVKLQKSYDGSTWIDVSTYTANQQDIGTEPERGVIYRLFVETGAYSSGTVLARLSQ